MNSCNYPKIWKKHRGCSNVLSHFSDKSVMECNAQCHKDYRCKKFVHRKNECWLIPESCSEKDVFDQDVYHRSEDHCTCKWNSQCTIQNNIDNLAHSSHDNLSVFNIRQQCKTSARIQQCRWVDKAPTDIDYGCYSNRYSDLKAAYGMNWLNLYRHYQPQGVIEGRSRYCG